MMGEQEKKSLREQTDVLKGQVETERSERIKVQARVPRHIADIFQ